MVWDRAESQDLAPLMGGGQSGFCFAPSGLGLFFILDSRALPWAIFLRPSGRQCCAPWTRPRRRIRGRPWDNGSAGSETLASSLRTEDLTVWVGRSPRTSPSSWAADRAVLVSPLQGSVCS